MSTLTFLGPAASQWKILGEHELARLAKLINLSGWCLTILELVLFSPGKPSSAKFESLGSSLTKRENGCTISADKGYAIPYMCRLYTTYKDCKVIVEAIEIHM